jgi:hypothetical protein
MSTTAADNSEPNSGSETNRKSEKKSARPQVTNKYAEARLAKKKQRRRAHRLTIKRSNTNG